ncbi:hypothetical protein KAR91_76080 [Candidatus Pacearchaeota archaeon]|nr:hypothetical protein [Candidatus Pacearchaeota archaeon]
MSENQTHYRKAFNSPYLSSADITEPTKLTIKCVKLELDKSKKSKDSFNTVYFVEKEIRQGEVLKPMILNAGNSSVVKNFARSPFLEDWHDIPITVYVDPNVRFGRETVEGLRISPDQPEAKKKELQPGTTAWENAVVAYKRDGKFDAVEKRMFISDVNKEKIKKEAE